jgi:hypothetical protein
MTGDWAPAIKQKNMAQSKKPVHKRGLRKQYVDLLTVNVE